MDISVDQIRMARALKRWTQVDLAKAAGVAKRTIYELERNNLDPQVTTFNKIKKALENAGIEFLEYNGVRERPKGIVDTLRGADGFDAFKTDVRNTALAGGKGHDICISNVNEELFQKWSGKKNSRQHRAVMKTIHDLSCRILTREGDKNFIASAYAKYRWLPETLYDDIPIYIYGDKTALISYQEDDVIVFVIEHKQVTEFYRKNFERMWRKAVPVE